MSEPTADELLDRIKRLEQVVTILASRMPYSSAQGTMGWPITTCDEDGLHVEWTTTPPWWPGDPYAYPPQAGAS